MKLCIRTNSIGKNPCIATRLASAWGMKHLELATMWKTRIPYLTRTQHDDLLQCIKKYKMDVAALSPGIYGPEVKATEKNFKEHFEEKLPQSIEMAKEFGAEILICFSFDKINGIEEDWVVEKLSETAEVAEREDIMLALEPEEAGYADTGEALARLVKAVDSKFLGVNWDPGNIVWAGKKDYPEGFQSVKRYIKHVHLKDVIFKEGLPTWVPVGEGVINYEAQLKALKEINYQGYLSIETEAERLIDCSKRSWENLREMLGNLGVELK